MVTALLLMNAFCILVMTRTGECNDRLQHLGHASCLNILQLGAILQMKRLLTEPFDGSLNHLGLAVVPHRSRATDVKATREP